ncbi:MAG: hypothetical protein JNL60_01670 [Bacteroidia bacterium]|nr:hypothetical protein [Bacteroidia bacterium]
MRRKRSVEGKKVSILAWAEAALMTLIVVVIITIFLLFLIFWAMRDVTFM